MRKVAPDVLSGERGSPGPILSVFFALIVHSELKSVHPVNLLILWIELVHYIIHELLKLCIPKNSLE